MRFTGRAAAAALMFMITVIPVSSLATSKAQVATPAPFRCETAATPLSGMAGMAMSTPGMAGHGMDTMAVEFDQLYIDMMLPNHASIIALTQAAQNRLTNRRLQGIAENIITSQSAENEELRGYREQWYGNAEPLPVDASMMGMMTEMIPGMGDMASMQQQMDPQALVMAFCAGEDPDLTFIELTIPHNEMAIQAPQAALEQAMHEELRTIAERVIADQQREIEELEAILPRSGAQPDAVPNRPLRHAVCAG